MIIDGRKIADELVSSMKAFVDASTLTPRLVALTADPDIPTQQFLRIKKRIAERVGISMEVVTLSAACTQEEVESALLSAVESGASIVLQLPFPKHIALAPLLSALPNTFDPDRMGDEARALLQSGMSPALPPVTSAIRLLMDRNGISPSGAHAVVVGQGRLVGAPTADWLIKSGARVTRFTRDAGVNPHIMRTADIVVLGAGVPGLVTPSMIREGVALFDAGTSEEGGRVVGDADPACADMASVFTPVPGGIGPIAVAELFGNVLRLQFDYQTSM